MPARLSVSTVLSEPNHLEFSFLPTCIFLKQAKDSPSPSTEKLRPATTLPPVETDYGNPLAKSGPIPTDAQAGDTRQATKDSPQPRQQASPIATGDDYDAAPQVH